MYFPSECLCSLIAISPPSSDEVWDRLAQLACKLFESFKHGSLESLHLHPAQQQTTVTHLWVNTKDLLSLTALLLYWRAACLQPWMIWNPILARQPYPSCLHRWLMFYPATLAKKIPSFDKLFSGANLADKPPAALLKNFIVWSQLLLLTGN